MWKPYKIEILWADQTTDSLCTFCELNCRHSIYQVKGFYGSILGFRLREKNYGHLFVSSRKKGVLNIINRQNTFITPRENPSFRVGVQKKSAKILTMEVKTVKSKKKTESGQKWLKIPLSCDYFEPL